MSFPYILPVIFLLQMVTTFGYDSNFSVYALDTNSTVRFQINYIPTSMRQIYCSVSGNGRPCASKKKRRSCGTLWPKRDRGDDHGAMHVS
jgi:hypothetical protein